MTLEQRVANCEHYIAALISDGNRKDRYNEFDKDALRDTDTKQGVVIDKNVEDIDQNTADIDFIAMEAGIDLEE